MYLSQLIIDVLSGHHMKNGQTTVGRLTGHKEFRSTNATLPDWGFRFSGAASFRFFAHDFVTKVSAF